MDAGKIVRLLRASGADVKITHQGISLGGELAIVLESRRPPTRSDLAALSADAPVIVYARKLPPAAIRYAEERPHLTLVSDEAVVYQSTLTRVDGEAERPKPSRGPRPYARFAVGRAYLANPGADQDALADLAGVTQGSVSNAMRRIRTAATPAGLFDELVTEYPGAGGKEFYWWSDRPLADQAKEMRDARLLLSGDFAADQISPWRVPERVIAYAREPIDLAALGYVLTEPTDFTVLIVVPDDRTLWATAKAWALQVADPVIAAYDLLRTATTGDEREAANKLRTFAERRHV